jgi:transcriptional regulator with XRE-family HTH domain
MVEEKENVTTMTAAWIKNLLSTDDGRKLVECERLLAEVTESLCRLMEDEGVSRADLARRLNRTPAFITKLLRGSHNFTLQTLSDIFFAMGRSVHIDLAPVGDSLRLPAGEVQTIPTDGLWMIRKPITPPAILTTPADAGRLMEDDIAA